MANYSTDGHGDLDLTLSPSTTLYSPSPPFEKHCLPRLEIDSLDTSPFSVLFSGMIKDELPIFKTQLECAAPMPPDSSYDIERFTNLNDLESGWYDEDVEEILVLSPKRSSRIPFANQEALRIDPNVKFNPTPDFESVNALPLAEPTATTTTRLCRKRDTGRIYVMKTFFNAVGRVPLEHEILQVINDLKAPFLPQILWSFPGEKDLSIITDYYPRKNLEGLISGGGPLISSEALFYASEIIQAISFLHTAGIIHRDLNPGNIMIDTDGHVVLTGYADADIFPRPGARGPGGRHFSKMHVGTGEKSILFQAPELVLGWAHDFSVDCWSFGVLLHYMLSGKCLFSAEDVLADLPTLKNRIVHEAVVLSPLLEHESRDLICKCLERSSIARLTLEAIRGHAYFSSVDWKQVSAKNIPVPHLLDPTFDTISDLTLVSGRQRTTSLVSQSDGLDCRHSEALEAGNATSIGFSSVGLRRRNIQSLPRIFRMSSLLDDVPEEAEDTTSVKTYRAGDSSADSSGIYGDSYSSNNRLDEVNGPCDSDMSRRDRIAQFWVSLDLEQEAATSLHRMRSVSVLGTSGRSRKLRKARSAVSVHPLRRFSTLSASSLHAKLRKKIRPTTFVPAVPESKHGECQGQSGDEDTQVGSVPRPVSVTPSSGVTPADFPTGIKQIGSGIGFTYNLPPDLTKSKASICTASNAPLACHGMFQGLGLTGLGLRLGSTRSKKAKEKIRGTLRGLGSSVSMSMSASGVSGSASDSGAGGVTLSVSGRDDEFGGSNWSLMAVPSGTVLVIGDEAVVTETMESGEVDSPVSPHAEAGRVEVRGVFGEEALGELEPGVVGRSACEAVGSYLGDDGNEVVTLRLVPSPPAEFATRLEKGDEATSVCG